MRKSILSIALSVAVLTLFLTLSTISIAGVANDPVILTGDDALTEPGDRGWTPLEQDRPDAPWITKWYMPGRYMNNGGFATSGPIDVVKDASGGALTQESLSTVDGLMKTQTTKLDFGADNGGADDWTVKEIDPTDGNNMSTIYDGADDSDFDTWAIIVIESPKDHVAVMSPAHDDFAQIWVNGDKYWNDSAWTGGATKVNYDVPINLNEGANVLLYRCGESGGSDYFNLHLDDTTMSAVSIFPKDSTDQDSFFKEISSIVTAVDSKSKLPVFWGAVKSTK
ncbi:hypothetical protein CMK15_10135 [Candidatus Poribacteria bacterium]|nr:hypothetical protein [Candidatus Poribacteria bacterium]